MIIVMVMVLVSSVVMIAGAYFLMVMMGYNAMHQRQRIRQEG